MADRCPEWLTALRVYRAQCERDEEVRQLDELERLIQSEIDKHKVEAGQDVPRQPPDHVADFTQTLTTRLLGLMEVWKDTTPDERRTAAAHIAAMTAGELDEHKLQARRLAASLAREQSARTDAILALERVLDDGSDNWTPATKVAEIVGESRRLLADLRATADDLRESALTVKDWPADAVLGEAGVQAIEAVVSAYERLSARLSNYTEEARHRRWAEEARRG